jgi:hypothetical protein
MPGRPPLVADVMQVAVAELARRTGTIEVGDLVRYRDGDRMYRALERLDDGQFLCRLDSFNSFGNGRHYRFAESDLSPYKPREPSMPETYYPTDEDVRAIGDALKTHAEPLTIEAIEQNPWHAVARDLPHDAGAELAAAVVKATDELGERATKWGNRTDDPEERKAWHDLAELAQRRGEGVEAQAHERAAGAQAYERAAARGEPKISGATPTDSLTLDAIRQDPWNAVKMDIPDDADIELLGEIARTARELRVDAEGRAEAAQSAQNDEERERWVERAEAADFRFDEASLKLAEARAQEAWRAPAFSYETIHADAWTAVHLPIPEQAEPELLAYARNWASDLGRYAELGGRYPEFGSSALGEPLVNAENFTREQNIDAAADRVAALDMRLELAREQMAERHHDEWELVHGAHGVEELPSQLEHRQAGESARLEEIIAWSRDTSAEVSRGMGEPGLTSEEMDKWLEAQHTVEAAQEQERSRSHGEFLSGTLIASHASASLARTTEMLLKDVIEYFVPEPALTPEQARLASLAHAERSEAMEFEAARRENAAALDAVNTEIDRHRPHVQPEEPVRPDSIYERYPGLTRDIDADQERTRNSTYERYAGLERDEGMEQERSYGRSR